MKIEDKETVFNEYKPNNIYNVDCYEAIKKIPDKSIDLIVTDPPYGINADKGVGRFGSSKTHKHYEGGWDNTTPSKDLFEQILRIGKKVIIFGGNYFTDKLPVNGHWLVWDKIGNYNFKNPFSDCELIWTNINKNIVKKYICIQQGFVNDDKSEERLHPTQKPVALLEYLIKTYTNENDIVLDNCMGSGSTGVACINTNRNFIGIELDENYFNIAKKRIEGMVIK